MKRQTILKNFLGVIEFMATVLEKIKNEASKLSKNIILPEGEDSRVVLAAAKATKEGLAKITLLGDIAEITAKNPDVDLTGVDVINPITDPNNMVYAKILFDLLLVIFYRFLSLIWFCIDINMRTYRSYILVNFFF